MKKLVSALICASLILFSAIGFAACTDKHADAVKLVAIAADQVGVADVDYCVVAEPAASAKVKAVETLNFSGNLQQLYGSANGYPQAVIVAKTQLATGSSFVNNFVSALAKNAEWLADETTSIDTIVNAVQSHLTDGMSPTFSSKNLTKQVISNCGLNFVSASDDKEEIISFMQKLNSVSETPFGMPSENFFWDGSFEDVAYDGTVSVYAPDGAPALGIANLLAEDADGVNYEIVDANTIQTYVAGANPKADLCVLPVNLAVKILGSGQNYKLVGTLTRGNLYMLSNGNTQITSENLSSLKGKTVGVVNLPAVPGLTFKLILKNNGIEYVEEV